MLIRHARTGVLLLGAALVLTAASPAAAGQEQPATPTAGSGVAPPAQQQATPKQIRLEGPGLFETLTPTQIRPGQEVRFGVAVYNDSRQAQPAEFAVTFTLPPELTLTSLGFSDSRQLGSTIPCDGNVCRAAIRGGADIENQTQLSIEGRARLSSSFRGDTTTIRADLQEDANADPNRRTGTLTLSVVPLAAGQPAAGAPSSGTGTGMTTLPRTGDRTTATALVALSMLVLGAAAQAAGRRRPAATIG